MDDPRKWVQIANDLRGKINSGELVPGRMVFVVVESQARGVARETARKAISVLEKEGLLKAVPSYGFLVTWREGLER